ncbi:MAG: CheF family chemotaxis protein [Halobacteriaceae archaeon]
MSEGERKLIDQRGKFAMAVKDDRQVEDATWSDGRILLSTRRLVLAGSGGKRTIPLSAVETIGGRYDVNQAIAQISGYVAVGADGDVLLVRPNDSDVFEQALYKALLDRESVLVRHPAVEGGVVQDTDWEKGRLTLGESAVKIAVASGSLIDIALDDVGGLETGERTVADEQRTVLEAEHTEAETSVETYIAGPQRRLNFLESMLETSVEAARAALDLDETEKQVLMALYSGVSPFEIPGFVGMDVDDVEENFERLIELDVLEEVRKRREVTLTTRGRNLASESIGEQ